MSIDQRLCYGCGIVDDRHPNMGIIPMLRVHSCRLNTHYYSVRNFKFADLNYLFGGAHPLDLFNDLSKPEQLTHFEAIKEDTHPTDRRNYELAREFEVKYLNRILKYTELETNLFYSY